MAEYIDRSLLGIGRAKEEVFENPVYARGWNAAISIIESAPIADVEKLRHGRWKKRKNWDKYVCSECSGEEDMARHYCPNCGAKMDREDLM